MNSYASTATCLLSFLLSFSSFLSAQNDINPPSTPPDPNASGYLGSSHCINCHENFYKLWSTSHHGLAMQPLTKSFWQKEITPQEKPLTIKDTVYQALLLDPNAVIREAGPQGTKDYPIMHVMGGKNFYYFLTLLERGRLQVLPLAYDVDEKKWYDSTGSMVRHFIDVQDQPLDWTDPSLTFNTSCYSCHVSQLQTNYDLASDSYHTTWSEPGINCETCHGPAAEHVRVSEQLKKGDQSDKTKLVTITQSRGYSASQVNDSCAPCHAKMAPITSAFRPGDDFFDHYDLTTLENIDFYPDGRDLGENYTYTLWLMSPCVMAGKLDCTHCHTSSGRNRFPGAKANESCLPCHENMVNNLAAHSHHPAKAESPTCLSCHMPTTEFARMKRTDHSMRPPMPALADKFHSPLACLSCHQKKDNTWADQAVNSWHKNDYQQETIQWATLIHDARSNRLPPLKDMAAVIQARKVNEVVRSSLVRLLAGYSEPSAKLQPLLLDALTNDPSPLVRSSAANLLGNYLDSAAIAALAQACDDPVGLVRVRAATHLANIPEEHIPFNKRTAVKNAVSEFIASMQIRMDDWVSHYNMGNYHLNGSRFAQAAACFKTASRFRPDIIPPLINASMAYNLLGQNQQARDVLLQAIKLDPNNPAPHLNLALLLGEMNQMPQAQQEFEKVLWLDPNSDVAAYNLAVILAPDQPARSLGFIERAWTLRPDNHKYGYTYAFYLLESGDKTRAMTVLQDICNHPANYPSAYMLLGDLLEKDGRVHEAVTLYKKAEGNSLLSPDDRNWFTEKIRQLNNLNR